MLISQYEYFTIVLNLLRDCNRFFIREHKGN